MSFIIMAWHRVTRSQDFLTLNTQERDTNVDKTTEKPSYLYKGSPYTGKATFRIEIKSQTFGVYFEYMISYHSDVTWTS